MPIEHVSLKDENELINIVCKEMDILEKGLTLIGCNVPIDERTRIGMLCHDENGQLVIVQLSVEEGNQLLFNALRCFDYVNKFKMMLKATHPKSKIDASKTPRLILLAPNYPEELINIAKHMKGIQINLYTWEYLKIGDYKDLHIEPIFISKPPETKPMEEKPEKETKTEEKKQVKEKKRKEIEPEKTKEKEKEEPPEPVKPKIPKPTPPPTLAQPKPPAEIMPPKPAEKKEQQKKKLKLF